MQFELHSHISQIQVTISMQKVHGLLYFMTTKTPTSTTAYCRLIKIRVIASNFKHVYIYLGNVHQEPDKCQVVVQQQSFECNEYDKFVLVSPYKQLEKLTIALNFKSRACSLPP